MKREQKQNSSFVSIDTYGMSVANINMTDMGHTQFLFFIYFFFSLKKT